jgi:hypothetical protein
LRQHAGQLQELNIATASTDNDVEQTLRAEALKSSKTVGTNPHANSNGSAAIGEDKSSPNRKRTQDAEATGASPKVAKLAKEDQDNGQNEDVHDDDTFQNVKELQRGVWTGGTFTNDMSLLTAVNDTIIFHNKKMRQERERRHYHLCHINEPASDKHEGTDGGIA